MENRPTLEVDLLSSEERLLARQITGIVVRYDSAMKGTRVAGIAAAVIFLLTLGPYVMTPVYAYTKNVLLPIFALFAAAYIVDQTVRSLCVLFVELRMLPVLRNRLDALVERPQFETLCGRTEALATAGKDLGEELALCRVAHHRFVTEAITRAKAPEEDDAAPDEQQAL